MQFKPLSQSVRANALSTIVIATLLTNAACSILRPGVTKATANILQGEQYVHRIQLPGAFVRSAQDPGSRTLGFHRTSEQLPTEDWSFWPVTI